MLEIEKTYLAKYLPDDLGKSPSKEIVDIYIPTQEIGYARTRIRKNGDKHEITKKTPLDENDFSQLQEETIHINEEEFDVLKNCDGHCVRKIRYNYSHKGKLAEIDVFQDSLKGLVLVDFEFDEASEKDSHEIPEFCLADVTHEEEVAGHYLAQTTYDGLKDFFEKFNYQRL